MYGWMDRPMGGWTDGQTDRQTNRRKEGRREGRTDGQIKQMPYYKNPNTEYNNNFKLSIMYNLIDLKM